MPRKAVDLMAQVGALAGNARPISAADVIDRFHTMFQVPRLLVDPEVPFDPNQAEHDFNRRVLEQPEAVQAVIHMISMIKAGLSDSRRPFGVFLFVGPTGVGKTHIAQMLAEFLLGSADRVVRLNMADYPEADDALVLFGNPSGYAPSIKRGVLTQRLMGQPFSVLLLDEFEKAHRTVHDRFLQLFDEGSFVNGDGESVSCRSSIVIATSNAGAEIYRRRAVGFSDTPSLEELDRELDRRLPEHFRFELLNRFDRVVHFHPLSRRGIRSIARREVDLIKSRSGLTSRAVTVRVSEAVIDWVTANGYDPFNGARFLRRTIERHLTTALADALVRDRLREGAEIDLGVRGGRVVARAVEDPAPSEPVEVSLPQGPGERVLKLDRAALEAEARALVEFAKPRLAELDQKRDAATRLLETMAARGFWDDRAASTRALDDHRRLDVAIQRESRLARPILLLAEVLSEIHAGRSVPPGRLGPLLVEASEALRSWEHRRAEQGPGASWVVVRSLDPTRNAAEEIERLVTIERAWAGRLHLAAGVAAFGVEDDQLARAIVEVEGPGSQAYFEMERGVHRFVRSNRGDLRLRVDVVPKGEGPAADARARPLQERTSALDLEATWTAAIEHAETGRRVDIYGADRDVLSAILRDVGPLLIDEPDDRRVIRVYARDGVGARDARTGASVGRFKDVLAGRLDALHDAWRRAQEPAG
jgi:MoxR-like ATPase